MTCFPLDSEQLRRSWQRVQTTVEKFQLPFRSVAQPGMNGSWLGSGIGSSIDYQDHRPYLPGDDPRYIDWQAYARSGSYIMKLYRDEITPKVDIVVDLSASMALDSAKAERTLDLAYFSVLSAVRSQSSVRIYFVRDGDPLPVPIDSLVTFKLNPNQVQPDLGPTFLEALPKVPFRSGSLRVIISDLLFPGLPDSVIGRISGSRSQVIIFVPQLSSESNPDWLGNIQLDDCESSDTRKQIVDTNLLERYQAAYRRHFRLWDETGRRYGVRLMRLSAEQALEYSFAAAGHSSGAVEPCL
jgi:uncharacterized protein (DUF58 family)